MVGVSSWLENQGDTEFTNYPKSVQWKQPSLLYGWAQAAGSVTIAYAIDASGFVRFRGTLNPAAATSSIAFYIPANSADVNQTIIIPGHVSGNRSVQVYLGGSFVIADYNSNSDTIDLSGLSYHTNNV